MTNYVYSTLANDNRYAVYVKGGADLPRVARTILVKGGAGVADSRLVTPRGVVTTVTDDELESLLDSKVFNRHLERGFVTVSTAKEDPEAVAADMASRDASAPVVPEDYTADEAGAKPAATSKRQK